MPGGKIVATVPPAGYLQRFKSLPRSQGVDTRQKHVGGGVVASTRIAPIDMKLEVVVLGVSDVDRAKAFYMNLGWRLDADFATSDGWRVVQVTPHNSQASVIFGNRI